MSISSEDFANMFSSVADVWKSNTDILSEIDSKFGDGDHGVTIAKIANLILKSLLDFQNYSLKDFIEKLSDDIIEIGGGSSGPLFGTMIGGLAIPLENGTVKIYGNMLKSMFNESLESMFEITKARVGDKTMMDALIPAVEASRLMQGSCSDILKAAAEAANAGAKASENMISKFGRARMYKEQTIGTADAGALSTALFFEALSIAQN